MSRHAWDYRRDIGDHDCGDAICPTCGGTGGTPPNCWDCTTCQGSGVVVGLLPNLGQAR